ncbi:MAG: type I phosphomannose isomerase catalytic subunit, partial [Cetobacterium sp.]
REKIKVQDATIEELIRGEYFSIDRLLVDGVFQDESYKNFKIYSILDGEGKLKSNEIEYEVKKGDTYFIPANTSVIISGKLEIMKSYI